MWTLLASVCIASAAQAEMLIETPMIEVGGHAFSAEIAADDDSRMRGLMFRDSLSANASMLFIFEQQQPLAFWMRNTRIPLDILYFDSGGKLVSVQADAPPCRTARCPVFPSEHPAQFVVELNAGTVARLGITPGQQLCVHPPLSGPLPFCDASNSTSSR